MTDRLTAITYVPGKKNQFVKYRLKKTESEKKYFLIFIKEKFPSAMHVNFYDKKTKAFIEQVKL